MFNPKLSAIGIAPLSSTIGTILTKNTIKYFNTIGKLAIINLYDVIINLKIKY